MRKNKPVEVEIKEHDTHDDLFVGKKLIGNVTQLSDAKFQVETTDGILGVYKTREDALEQALKHWNLHN